MTERHDREGDASGHRKVKVTDKRRTHHEASDPEGPPEEVFAQREGRARASDEGGPPGSPREDDLESARKEAAEYLEHLQRLKAEFDNYRKRVLREQTRAVEFANEPLVMRLLEVLDEFELALVAAEQNPEVHKFVSGVEMVYAKLADILKAEGLERIDAEGKPFDPALHEALFQADGGEGEQYVSDVLRPGYTLKGRVIRPAGVKVARR
ncbi:MAG TPA: nucleotide exchange factor GrpE [Actinomycetota bacterium]|nr:nucleotide exchange factor GrpE [Actinomycetota bacterium]